MVTTLQTPGKKAIHSTNYRWQLKKMNVEIAMLLTIGQPRRNLNHMNLEGSLFLLRFGTGMRSLFRRVSFGIIELQLFFFCSYVSQT